MLWVHVQQARCLVMLVAFVLLICCSSSSALCQFGTQPGEWNRSLAPGHRWQFNAKECRLEPLLRRMRDYERKRFLSMTTGDALRDPRSKLIRHYRHNPPKWQKAPTNIYKRSHPLILFLGDHHDRWLALDACQFVRGMKAGTLPHCPRYPDLSQDADADERSHRYMYFRVCENGAASFAMRYIPGVNPIGPYHKQEQLEGVSSSNSSWAARTEETLSMFSRFFRRDPDMVVVHSNHWDLMGLRWQGEQQAWLKKGLPQRYINQWTYNMTAWLKHLKYNLPLETLILMRTAPLPKIDTSGRPYLREIGGTLPIAQINNATRIVARVLNITLLDIEMHVRHTDPKAIHRDNINPSNWVNLEWINMILNILKQHRPRLFSHVNSDIVF